MTHYHRWWNRGDPLRSDQWHDPLTAADYAALQASVDTDARRLLPLVWAHIIR